MAWAMTLPMKATAKSRSKGVAAWLWGEEETPPPIADAFAAWISAEPPMKSWMKIRKDSPETMQRKKSAGKPT